MKTLKAVLYVLVVAGALAAFGWFFVSQLGSGRTDGLAGVMLSPRARSASRFTAGVRWAQAWVVS
jgi:hypothetical protein